MSGRSTLAVGVPEEVTVFPGGTVGLVVEPQRAVGELTVAPLLPLHVDVTHVDLQWWEAATGGAACRLLHRWSLRPGSAS